MFFKCARSNKPITLVKPVNEGGHVVVAGHSLSLNPADNFYLEDWAVSSMEDWGPNDNWDGFERAELKKAHKTFIGSWVCIDHQNWEEKLAIGENVDAVYTPQHYVKVLMQVNKKLAEDRLPGLQNAIETGQITDTSMGAWCKISVCNACGNVAAEPHEFCGHVKEPIRGSKICDSTTNWAEKVACELNRGVVFFENSIITESEGADGNAKILATLASKVPMEKTASGIYISGDKLFFAMKEIASQAHGEDEKMRVAHFINELARLLDGEE